MHATHIRTNLHISNTTDLVLKQHVKRRLWRHAFVTSTPRDMPYLLPSPPSSASLVELHSVCFFLHLLLLPPSVACAVSLDPFRS